MAQLTTTSSTPALPRLSPALDWLRENALNGYPIQVRAAIRDEARRAKAALDALCLPVSQAVADPSAFIAAWMLPLAAGCTIPLTSADFDMRMGAIAPVLAELPRALFTPATAKAALLEFAYFPGAKEIYTWLRAQCGDWLRDRDALAKIASAVIASDRPAVTPDERDAAGTALRAGIAATARKTADVRPVQPSYVPDDALLRELDRIVVENAAATPGTPEWGQRQLAESRGAVLRRKLGLDGAAA